MILLMYCIVFPLIVAFFLRFSDKRRVIQAGIFIPVIMITVAVLLIDGEFGMLIEVAYLLWVTVFLISTYIHWLVMRKIVTKKGS